MLYYLRNVNLYLKANALGGIIMSEKNASPKNYDSHVHISAHASGQMNIRTDGRDIGKGSGTGHVDICNRVTSGGKYSLNK